MKEKKEKNEKQIETDEHEINYLLPRRLQKSFQKAKKVL